MTKPVGFFTIPNNNMSYMTQRTPLTLGTESNKIKRNPAVRICVGIRICVGLPYSRITVLTLTGIFGDAFFFRVLPFENFFGSCETGGHD